MKRGERGRERRGKEFVLFLREQGGGDGPSKGGNVEAPQRRPIVLLFPSVLLQAPHTGVQHQRTRTSKVRMSLAIGWRHLLLSSALFPLLHPGRVDLFYYTPTPTRRAVSGANGPKQGPLEGNIEEQGTPSVEGGEREASRPPEPVCVIRERRETWNATSVSYNETREDGCECGCWDRCVAR